MWRTTATGRRDGRRTQNREPTGIDDPLKYEREMLLILYNFWCPLRRMLRHQKRLNSRDLQNNAKQGCILRGIGI
jgi:hypothetical protein